MMLTVALAIIEEEMHSMLCLLFIHSDTVVAGLYQSALALLASQPSMLRLFHAPRQPRRFWSLRRTPGSAKEANQGAWESIIMGRAVEWAAAGFPDVEDAFYFKLFRMNKQSFYDLYHKYGRRMEKRDTNRRQAIPGPKRMAIFLSYLAHGHKQTQLATMWDVSQPSVSNIIADGIAVFKQHMVRAEIRAVAGEAAQKVAEDFKKEWGLPNCIGAVDGTFFHIQQPSGWGDAYWCYKRMYGIIVLAVCDPHMLFTYVNAGSPGSVGDAAVWNACSYKKALFDGDFDFDWQNNSPAGLGSADTPVKPFVVADSAFALEDRVIKCYDDPEAATLPSDVNEMKLLNEAIIRTRRLIECAFGRLKQRWNVIVFNRIKCPREAKDVALICCALHNSVTANDASLLCCPNGKTASRREPVRPVRRAGGLTAADPALRLVMLCVLH